ncbi:hypothetical protein BpHYR1_037255 [Brachionus plicatilis]|uniref:Uncharacterized protein n=1 Tax=Brachionus plicatilis TaxID=10195 RepID=A0A3M7SFB2_BRAPC|nr:hypothetical protein BpHYR1_037255 [Brachionus plicatilis]
MVRKTTDHKVNKFKFHADRSMKPASYVLGDRVWYLKPAHKKGLYIYYALMAASSRKTSSEKQQINHIYLNRK